MSGSKIDSVWIQPQPGDPSPYILYGEELWRKRKEEGTESEIRLDRITPAAVR